MAPEQFLDPGDVDVRTDVFSLGAILYEMLSGEPAFKGKDGALLLSSTYIEEVVPLSEVAPECPPSVCAAVMKALEKEREDRFESIPIWIEAMYKGRGERSVILGGSIVTWDPPATAAIVPTMDDPLATDASENQPRSLFAILVATALLLVAGFALLVVLGLVVAGGSWILTSTQESSTLMTDADAIPPSPTADVAVDPEPIVVEETAPVEPVKGPTPRETKPAPPPPLPKLSEEAVPVPKEDVPALERVTPVTDAADEALSPEKLADEERAESAPEAPVDVVPPTWTAGRKTLRGQLYRQPFVLNFEIVKDQSFRAVGALTAGPSSRQIVFTGRYDMGDSSLVFKEVGGDLILRGTWTEQGFTGTYQRGKRKASSLKLAP